MKAGICISGHKFLVEDTVRRRWYDPEQILKDVGLRQGMVFADVGCGDGFFAILAAQLVGDVGRVYAVDVNPESIKNLREKAAEIGLKNLSAKVARAEDTVFCDACADIIFYSIVLHDFEDPLKVLQNAKKMLKSSGKIVDLDWKKQSMAFGPPVSIRFSETEAGFLIKKAGFGTLSIRDVGKYQYLVLAAP